MPKVMASAPNAGGRHQRGRGGGATLAEINVIPLVDVMLVLLIIFMVAAPLLQRGVEVNLPVATRADDISGERIFVDVPGSFADDRRVFIDEEGLGLDVLSERVRQLLVDRDDKQVFIRIDADLPVQAQFDVMDQLRAAGVTQVGLPIDPRQR